MSRAAVHVDPADAIDRLVEHLLCVGVRNPVVLDSAGPDLPSRRAALLQAAFARRGHDVRLVPAGEPTAEHGAAAAGLLLEQARRPDAIVAFNDVMALGVLSACRRAGVDVPGEVRVVGVNGLPLGALVTPTLTTLEVDVDEVARRAFQLTVGMVAGDAPRSGPEAERTVRHRLVLRESA